MARRSSTSMSSARNNESDPTSTDARSIPSGGSDSDPEADSSVDAGSSVDGSTTQGSDAATPPAKPRRKRGPNKPKPGTFTVETQAHMGQEEIIKLLTAHAITQLGADVAANMTLQVSVDGVAYLLGDALPAGTTLQFSTAKTSSDLGIRDRAQGRSVLPADE